MRESRGIDRFYVRFLVEGKGLLYLVITIALFIRVYNLRFGEFQPLSIPLSKFFPYLSTLSVFSSRVFQFVSSIILVSCVALIVRTINIKYSFIRIKTFLPSSLALLFLSLYKDYLEFTTPLIIAFLTSYVILVLVGGYNVKDQQSVALKSSFYLLFGAIFSPLMLIYLPLLWICLVKINCFSFKSFLVTLFSLVLWFLPMFTMVFYFGDIHAFIDSIKNIFPSSWSEIAIFSFNWRQYALLVLAIIILLVLVMDNVMNNFKDKIKVRVFLELLTVIEVFSILLYAIVPNHTTTILAVFYVSFSLHLGHYFTLAEKRKLMLVFFIILMTVYLGMRYTSFL